MIQKLIQRYFPEFAPGNLAVIFTGIISEIFPDTIPGFPLEIFPPIQASLLRSSTILTRKTSKVHSKDFKETRKKIFPRNPIRSAQVVPINIFSELVSVIFIWISSHYYQ